MVDLLPGETVMAEPGAMVTHSPSVSIATESGHDGLVSSAKSMLGGESAFANRFTARASRGP